MSGKSRLATAGKRGEKLEKNPAKFVRFHVARGSSGCRAKAPSPPRARVGKAPN